MKTIKVLPLERTWFVDVQERMPPRILARDARATIIAELPASASNPEVMCDAHLLAAANELFEAAKILAGLEDFDKHGKTKGRRFPSTEEMQVARDAIAKAEGR